MKDDFDIEEALGSYRHEPSEQVRRSVLNRFAGRAPRAGLGFLRRPVPLYIAAAQVVIAVTLGFVIAGVVPRSDSGPPHDQNHPVQIENGRESRDAITADLTWEAAANDLL